MAKWLVVEQGAGPCCDYGLAGSNGNRALSEVEADTAEGAFLAYLNNICEDIGSDMVADAIANISGSEMARASVTFYKITEVAEAPLAKWRKDAKAARELQAKLATEAAEKAQLEKLKAKYG